MRKQKYDTMEVRLTARLYSHEFPAGGSGVSGLRAVEKASHCQCPNPLYNRSTDGATERKGQGLSGGRRGQ